MLPYNLTDESWENYFAGSVVQQSDYQLLKFPDSHCRGSMEVDLMNCPSAIVKLCDLTYPDKPGNRYLDGVKISTFFLLFGTLTFFASRSWWRYHNRAAPVAPAPEVPMVPI